MASLPFDTVIFPPKNLVPTEQDVEANTGVGLSGLNIFAYGDATSVTTTLSVAHGTLTVAAMGGALVGGSGTGTVTIAGTAKQINSTLSASDNVLYHGAHDFFGTDTLTVVTNDGYGWPIGPLTDTDQMAIHVHTLLAGTAGDDAFTALPGNERIDALGGIDTIAFNFKLTDAKVSYVDGTVIVDGPSSRTVLTGFEIFKFTDGTVNNNDGSALIDDLFYYSRNHDVWKAGTDADQHYNQFGWHEGRDPNAFFDTAGYLANYADVQAANVNPLDHYSQFGWQEGRDPSIGFDTTAYLAAYADINAAHINPLAHFVQFGFNEGRSGFADGVWG